MSDPLEIIEVTIGGRAIRGFKSVAITVSLEDAARNASLQISDFEGADQVMPGDEATITANGELMLTGYVGTVSPSHSNTDHGVAIEIASRTIDAVEASIVHDTGFAEDKDIKQIAEEFDTCGVGIECDESFEKEARSFVHSGASLHAHLLPLAKSQGAFIYDTPEGKLRIAKKPRGRHGGALSIGKGGNILSATASLSEHGRHDEIIARGQSSRGSGAGALRLMAKGKDSSVRRRRPLIIVHGSETTPKKLQERVDRQARRAAGLSRTATITVPGWRDADGKIFEPHFLIAVDDPRIYTVQDMGIKSVSFSQDTTDGGAGTTAALSLVDPAAMNGEPGGGAKQFETPTTSPTVSAEGAQ